jgi:hypothetical protein
MIEEAGARIYNERQKIHQSETRRYPFFKTFIILFLFALIGAASITIMVVPQIPELVAAYPELGGLPDGVLVLVALTNTIILVAAATAVGTLTAPRVGLRSLIAEKFAFGEPVLAELRSILLLAFATGIASAVVISLLDLAFVPFIGEELQALAGQQAHPLLQLLMGMLYGGITEEILLRWGFMSLLVWLGWKVFQRKESRPGPAVFWVSILAATILFGIAHLPALASMVELNTVLVVRTVLLNAVGGLLFGWLYWRYHLEAAIIAHASAHVGLFLLKLAGIVSGG